LGAGSSYFLRIYDDMVSLDFEPAMSCPHVPGGVLVTESAGQIRALGF